MILSYKNGLLVEVSDPDHTTDTHRCWVSCKQAGPPTLHQILIYTTGSTLAGAVRKAAEALGLKESDLQTIHPQGRPVCTW